MPKGLKERIPVLRMVFEHLRSVNKAKTQKAFAKKVGYAETPLSRMLAGSKPIPFALLRKLYSIYDININFIVSDGKGEMLNSTTRAREKEIVLLNRQIEDKNKIIRLLEG